MRKVLPFLLLFALLAVFVPRTTQAQNVPGDDEAWGDDDPDPRNEDRQRRDEDRRRQEMEERRIRPGDEGRPRGPGREGLPPRPMTPLTEEQEADVVDFLQEYDAQRLEELQELKSFEPESYRFMLSNLYREMQELMRVKEEDPEAFKNLMAQRSLERETFQLAEKYRRAQEKELKALILLELRLKLSALFDYREAGKEREIRELEAEIQRLRTTMTKRKEKKTQIVEKRLKEMMGEEDEMGW